MKKLSILILAAVFMLTGSKMQAQTNVYFHLSAAIPTGDFADGNIYDNGTDWALVTDAISRYGGAGIGFNAGFKFNIATGVKGLSAMITLDGIYNGLNSDFHDSFEDIEDNYNNSFTTPKYINIPIMAGINYTYHVNSKFGLFAEGGIGPNLLLITQYEETYQNNYISSKPIITTTIEYKPTISFAYQIGTGIELGKKITIGVNFYKLGTSRIKGRYTKEENNSVISTHQIKCGRINPTMVMLNVGFKL